MHYAIVQQMENVGKKCLTRWYIVTGEVKCSA